MVESAKGPAASLPCGHPSTRPGSADPHAMSILGQAVLFDPLLPAPWTALAAAVLAAGALVGLWRWGTGLPPGRQWALAGLRLAVIGAAVLLMLRPTLRWTGRRPVPAEVVVLLDTSRSMALADAGKVPPAKPADAAESPPAPADETGTKRATGPEKAATHLPRWRAVAQAFAASTEALAPLARRAAVRPVAFGAQVRPAGGFRVAPTDPRTDLAQALRAVRLRAASGQAEGPRVSLYRPRPVAVVVVSDGRVNRGSEALEAEARRLADLAVPVHAVCVGADEPRGGVRDAAVRDLRAPRRVFAGGRAEVRATVTTLGLAGQAVEVTLSVDGQTVQRRTLRPTRALERTEVVFAPRLERVGVARIALCAGPVPGDLVPANDRSETTVRVEEGGARVWLLEGRLGPEGKFAARAIAGTREMELSRRLLVGPGAREAAPRPDEVQAADVLILDDPAAGLLSAETVGRIAEAVRSGRLGVLFLLGRRGKTDTEKGPAPALTDLLPFAPSAPDAGASSAPSVPAGSRGAPPGSAPKSRTPAPEKGVAFRLTPAGRTHFVFRTGEADGSGAAAAILPDRLPPLAEATPVGPLRPGSILLAEGEAGQPLLAVRQVGRGRVAALAFDTSWRWALAPEETGGPALHRRLWRRLALWLSGRDDRPRDDLWIATDRAHYLVLDAARPPVAEVRVGLRGAGPPRLRLEGPLAAEIPLRLTASDATGAGPIPSPPAPTEWRAAVPLVRPGTYTAVAEAEVGGTVKRAEVRFTVAEYDFEWAEPLADPHLLRRVAEAGGGRFARLEDLSALLQAVAQAVDPPSAPAERRLALAKGRPSLAAMVALMAAEWLLRRRWGLA